jgi:hypothetical protein
VRINAEIAKSIEMCERVNQNLMDSNLTVKKETESI